MHRMTLAISFLPEAKVGCHAEAFWLGAAAGELLRLVRL